jgi:putative Ca2+/H+ antiporter (TMEM165/GDT1 family)
MSEIDKRSANLLPINTAGALAIIIPKVVPNITQKMLSCINRWQKFGVFGATFILFFLAEIGDKTQIATVALAVWNKHPERHTNEASCKNPD